MMKKYHIYKVGSQVYKMLNLLLVISAMFLLSCAEKPQKPNIIFLLTDDHRYDALGAMGNKFIDTPKLDSLANRGVVFERSYVTTSICCTSRASILTGQYVSRHGIDDFHKDIVGEQLMNTYPLLLKQEAGYNIGFIGKYGVGFKNRPEKFFDYWTCEKMHQPVYEVKDKDGNYLHYTDKVGGDIVDFLDKFGKSDKPFCLSVSFKAPHVEDGDPRQFVYNPRYANLFSNDTFPVPETANDEYWMKFPEEFRNNNEARMRWHLRFSNPEQFQESIRGYYRLMKGVDDVVGIMAQKLKDLNIDKNTVIVFMGDNGFYFGEKGLAGKWFAHEESARVPFFIYDPGLKKKNKGKRVKHIALNIDLAPTLLAYAGVDIPNQMQGINVMDLVDSKHSGREDFFYEHNFVFPTLPKTEAYISEKYKYITYHEMECGFEEFYDLENDPLEKNNLINNKAYAQIIEEAKTRFKILKAEAK